MQSLEEHLQNLEGYPTLSMDVDPPCIAFFCSESNERNIPTAGSLSKIKVKVLTFDGEILWELYKSQFEVAPKLNEWSNKAKAGNLIVFERSRSTVVTKDCRGGQAKLPEAS